MLIKRPVAIVAPCSTAPGWRDLVILIASPGKSSIGAALRPAQRRELSPGRLFVRARAASASRVARRIARPRHRHCLCKIAVLGRRRFAQFGYLGTDLKIFGTIGHRRSEAAAGARPGVRYQSLKFVLPDREFYPDHPFEDTGRDRICRARPGSGPFCRPPFLLRCSRPTTPRPMGRPEPAIAAGGTRRSRDL